mgnify:FL=1
MADSKKRELEADVHELRAAERRMQRDLGQRRRTESSLVLRLVLKERENADLQEQLRELRQALRPAHSQTATLLLDPAVNAEIMRLREEVKEAQRREKEAQGQLEASQFQSGSIAGKKLMQKCKDLQAENDQLGKDLKDLEEGRVQKLRGDAALQKLYEAGQKKSLAERAEDIEYLAEELNTSQALVLSLRREVASLKAKA